MLIGCLLASIDEGEEVPPQQVVETEKIKYLTDYELSQLYSCKVDIRRKDGSIIEVTYEEAVMLMKIAVAEAGDDLLGQFYIMAVIINRLHDPNFPDNIKDIIYQDKQFSPIKDGRFEKAEPTLNSHLALCELEKGIMKCEAMYFESESVEDSWQSRNRELLFVYNGQRYYK